jgi:putative ABC transport system permease protein
VVDRATFVSITGESRAASAAIEAKPGADIAALKAAIVGAASSPSDVAIVLRDTIRQISLTIFDRTFAVTHGLQLAAIAISVIGVASGFAAVAYSRRREFGVLMHLGVTRFDLLKLLAVEGVVTALVAVALGIFAGLGIALILIEVVNRQSFHWGMDYSLAPGPLAIMALAVAALCGLAAALAGQRALGPDAVRLVRADE